MPHQNQAGVWVCLTAVRPAVPKRCSCTARKRNAERRVVHRRVLALARAVCRPQVADAVEGVELARAAPVLAQAGRVQRVAVGQHGGTGRGAIADIAVSAGAVRLADTQAQAVVGVAAHKSSHKWMLLTKPSAQKASSFANPSEKHQTIFRQLFVLGTTLCNMNDHVGQSI